MRRRRSSPVALSIVELMLALVITALVATAIAGMMAAVSTGVTTRRDSRSVLIRAHAAQSRLSAYVTPSECVLDLSRGRDLVLWLDDARRSGTVHASEVRWLTFEPDEQVIVVSYLRKPDSWTQVMFELADQELQPTANWKSVLRNYRKLGLVADLPLVDGVSSVAIVTDDPAPLRARHVTYRLGIAVDSGEEPVHVAATIHSHHQPQVP